MASNVERVIDYLEKVYEHPSTPKALKEDVEWAIDMVSSNKLYKGDLDGFKLQTDKPEVKVWIDMI